MQPAHFTDRMPGQLVEIGGLPGLNYAFIPASLPPHWEWPVELWPLLVKAKEELGRLDGVGRYLPNPGLLLTPLRRREAQRSSSLEGTYATPEQLLLFEINPTEAAIEGANVSSIQEIANYERALRLREETRSQLPLSLRLIRQLHQTLLEGVREAGASPGEFRRGQVKIGSDGRFVPPPANYLPELLDQLEKYLHLEKNYDPLVEAFLVHYQFETIHPFRDGNGRVGRLLLSITIEDWCGLSGQWLYMSAYFDRYRDEYINHLYRISTENDWTGWVRFCLNGVVSQSIDAQHRCDRLLRLKDDYWHRLKNGDFSGRIYQIVENLFTRPFSTTRLTMNEQAVSQPTARSDLEALVKIGILKEMQLRVNRQKAYYCEDIFHLSYED